MRLSLHEGIHALMRRDTRALSVSCKNITRGRPSVNQEEDLHQDPTHASTLILGFSASKTVRNTCLLFKPPHTPIYGILLQ